MGELENRFLSPTEQVDYAALAREIAGNALWARATGKQRDDAESLMYGLVSGAESSDVKRIRDKAEEGAAFGISEADMILFSIALQMYDANNNGGYDIEETTNAANAIEGLTREERAYLFSTANKSKNNPFD